MARETDAWRELGAERAAEFVLPPSGSLESNIACQLNNPTFYSTDPWRQDLFDISNPSIWQLSQAGFTPDTCLIYDHFVRRDRTDDVHAFYPDVIRRLHEDFLLSLRKHMTAKIEICWGKKVQCRMEQLLRLEPVRLWGRYEGTTIHLELDGDSGVPRIHRLLIFVRHPQAFFRIGSESDFAIHFRQTVSRNQDALLQVAAKLGGITIPHQFYETKYTPWKGPSKLKLEYLAQSRELEKNARNEIRMAVPDKVEKLEATTFKLLVAELQLSTTLPSSALTETSEVDEVRILLLFTTHILDD